MSLRDDALEMHRENQGKLEITPNVKVTNKQQLSLILTWRCRTL